MEQKTIEQYLINTKNEDIFLEKEFKDAKTFLMFLTRFLGVSHQALVKIKNFCIYDAKHRPKMDLMIEDFELNDERKLCNFMKLEANEFSLDKKIIFAYGISECLHEFVSNEIAIEGLCLDDVFVTEDHLPKIYPYKRDVTFKSVHHWFYKEFFKVVFEELNFEEEDNVDINEIYGKDASYRYAFEKIGDEKLILDYNKSVDSKNDLEALAQLLNDLHPMNKNSYNIISKLEGVNCRDHTDPLKLAIIYKSGIWGYPDYKKSIDVLRKVGYSEKKCFIFTKIPRNLFNGIWNELEKNTKGAIKYYKESIKTEELYKYEAMRCLALLIGSVDLLRIAADNNDPIAVQLIAEQLIKTDIENAEKYAERTIELQQPYSHYTLALVLCKKYQISSNPEDYSKAIEAINKSFDNEGDKAEELNDMILLQKDISNEIWSFCFTGGNH